jgi:hypothetical protein
VLVRRLGGGEPSPPLGCLFAGHGPGEDGPTNFAGATVAPAVSQAQYKINGGKSASGQCQMLTEFLNEDMQHLEKARAEGNQNNINYYRTLVSSDMDAGYRAGCA